MFHLKHTRCIIVLWQFVTCSWHLHCFRFINFTKVINSKLIFWHSKLAVMFNLSLLTWKNSNLVSLLSTDVALDNSFLEKYFLVFLYTCLFYSLNVSCHFTLTCNFLFDLWFINTKNHTQTEDPCLRNPLDIPESTSKVQLVLFHS